MNRRTKWIATGAVAAAALAVGSGIAVASGADDEEPPIPQGSSLDRATAVALKETGGGKVTGSEQEDGGYEIEVTLEDGSVVDVELDGDFKVTGTDSDSESDEGSGADDEANETQEDEANEGSEGADAANE